VPVNMCKLAALACVLLLAAVATATPLTSFGVPRRQEAHPDRDVEAVEPVNTGAGRGPSRPTEVADTDETPEDTIVIRPIFVPLGTLGRPVLRPVLRAGDSDEDASDESSIFVRPAFADPMADFMSQMAEVMTAMRRHMAAVLEQGGGSSRDDTFSDFGSLGKTTSTTRNIDGHLVTVNETTIGGDDDSPAIHIRVIDVRPSEEPDSAEQDGKSESDDGERPAGQDSEEKVTPKPESSENDVNEVPVDDSKVGSEVADLNA